MKILFSILYLVWLLPFTIGLKSNNSYTNSSFTENHLLHLKLKTRQLFNHGWDSYMKFGYPEDEIMPISCVPYTRDSDIFNIHRNDVLGNYSLTLLDTITTFAIMEDVENFTHYINLVKDVEFNKDSTVQVFETTIRALGSLLSAHLYAHDKFNLKEYDGFLLDKAYDLGKRLLPAYNHKTGLPLARINLSKGDNQSLPKNLIKETCSAGAASPFLELTLLSILTNDTTFENYSQNAFYKLWNSRSKLNLIPMTIDPIKGVWLDSITGIGASIDSFYEYALKGAILFDNNELMEIWQKSYNAISTHSKIEWFFGNIHIGTGLLVSPWIDSLGAFFSGLLVLAGDVNMAQKAHLPYMKLWNQYQGIPERWDFLPTNGGGGAGGTGGSNDHQKLFGSDDVNNYDPISLEWYPLRPEFIESTYYLYRATKDPIYLRIGEKILQDYENLFKVECGFAGFKDVRTRDLQDRMESFVLSETFMYLYLLFDEPNPINHDESSIFSTEGHPFWIPKGMLKGYEHHKKLLLADSKPLELQNETSGHDNDVTNDGIINQIYQNALLWSREKFANILKPLRPDFNIEKISNDDDNDHVMENEISDVLHLSMDIEDLETCEVPNQSNYFFSNFMNDLNLFTIDSKFHNQWKYKPNVFELDHEFYNTFTNPLAYCQREQTTQTLEFLVGERNEIPNVQLKKIQIKTSRGTMLENIYLSSLNGLRMKIEVLSSGSIDRFNQDIDMNFLNRYQTDVVYHYDGYCKPEDEIYANSVLRVQVVNGINIKDANTMIYLPKYLFKSSNINSITVTKNGYVKIENTIVMNMRVLDI